MSNNKYQFKGTPGPWALSDKQVDAIIAPHVDSNTDKYYGGFLVCESVTKPNRRLISTAPELLEFATMILSSIDYGGAVITVQDYQIEELRHMVHKALDIEAETA